MKLKIQNEEFTKIKKILKNINFNLSDMKLFFPLEHMIVETNEYGITKSQYKNETHYGSTLISGLSLNNKEDHESDEYICLSYCSTVDLYSFNLGEYLNLTDQPNLTKEDIYFISQYEVAIGKTSNIYYSTTALKDFSKK